MANLAASGAVGPGSSAPPVGGRPAREPIVVLGAGIAGLAASITARAPVFEAEQQVGGVAASDTEGGFTFDRGIHVLQAVPGRVSRLLDECGVRLVGRQRQAYIHSHGTYTAYPFQVNTAGLPLRLRVRCVRDFLGRPKQASPRNYDEWMRIKLGDGFAETFLIPYSEKFWTVHPREMTYEWTGNRVPQPSTLQVLRGALWSRQTRLGTTTEFLYPCSAPGYGAIGEAMARQVPALFLGRRAVRVDVASRTVHFDIGQSIGFERLISTIPLPELVAICPQAPDAVRAAADRLRTNSILVVNLGIARPGRHDWHWVHYPEKHLSFFRISFPHNFTDIVTPPGMSSISAEVAYSAWQPLDRASIVERVIDDLIRVGVLGREDRIVTRSTADIRYAYCIHDFERKDAVRTIRQWMIAHGVVPTGRYGHWNYFWSHEAIMSGLRTGEKTLRDLCGGATAIEGDVDVGDDG